MDGPAGLLPVMHSSQLDGGGVHDITHFMHIKQDADIVHPLPSWRFTDSTLHSMKDENSNSLGQI